MLAAQRCVESILGRQLSSQIYKKLIRRNKRQPTGVEGWFICYMRGPALFFSDDDDGSWRVYARRRKGHRFNRGKFIWHALAWSLTPGLNRYNGCIVLPTKWGYDK